MSTLELSETKTLASGNDPMATMLQLLFGKHISYSVSSVARLGVPDHMNSKPVHVDDLAAKVQAHPDRLYRIMRMLSSVGVFEEHADRRFTLTPVGDLLKTDAPGTLRDVAMMWGSQWSTRGFGHLTDAIRTGSDGITLGYGKHLFELLPHWPEDSAESNRAMVSLSSVVGSAVARAYNFSGISRLCDVGGGYGRLLTSIMDAYVDLRGVLFDLPHVIREAQSQPGLENFRSRLDFEAGSFLESVPPGCDAYILKHIIHDWDDDRACRILELIRQRLGADGRILLCEAIISEDAAPSPAKMLDIEMLALTPGGRERTVSEFEELFRRAGLRLHAIVPNESPLSVIEARPRT